MSEAKAPYAAGVTQFDAAAETLARWRAALPEITTAQAYAEAVALLDALAMAVEAFEEGMDGE